MAWDKVSMKNAVSSFLVSNEDGSFDLEASVLKFRETALRFVANTETDDALITECLYSVFAVYPGARLNVLAITSTTIQAMGKKSPELSDPKLYTMLSKRVAEVLKSLSGDEDVKPFNSVRGKGGGHFLKSDQAPAVAV